MAVLRIGVGGVSAGAAQLVGRERELAMLRGLIASAAGGNGSVVMVFGEPGIGKTRLVGEAAALARAEGAAVCYGIPVSDTGWRQGQNVPIVCFFA